MIHHVVAMKFKDPADAPEAKAKLDGLSGRVPAISRLHVGLDALHRDGSYHLLLSTEHLDEGALGAYQQDPAHLEIAGWLRERLEHRAVVDWEG